MASSTLKLRKRHHLPHARAPERSACFLNDCLKVSQKTILKHSGSSPQKVLSRHSPTKRKEKEPVERKTNTTAFDISTSWKVVKPRLNVKPAITQMANTSSISLKPPPRQDQVFGLMACPVINVQIRRKESTQAETNLHQQILLSSRQSPRQVSVEPPTPVYKQDQANQLAVIVDKSKDIDEKCAVAANSFKRRSLTVRGSLADSKRKQIQEKDQQKVFTVTPLTNECKSGDYTEILKTSNILKKSYSPESATSVLQGIASSISKQERNVPKNNLWQNPITDSTKKPSDRRDQKRSKTSTGHYQDSTSVSFRTRETKSASATRPQRCATAITSSHLCLTDSEVSAICHRLEDFLYNENLLKFQELVRHYSLEDRKRLVDFKETPTTANVFFRACGLVKLLFVNFILEACNPDLELTGPFLVNDDHTQYLVTPLWQAAVTGCLELVHILKEKGGNINATSNTGSSPLLAACYMSNVEVATYLVSNKASINTCNAKGLSCLMNAVQSLDLVRLLILNGAEINRADNYGNTPLHFAAEEGRLKTVKVLLEHGGNPLNANIDGYSVIQYAAKYRRREILEHFLQVAPLKVGDIVSAYELIGAMVILMEEDIDGGFLYLHKATTLRSLNKEDNVTKTKQPSILSDQDENVSEFSNLQELNELANNPTKLSIQALMIFERQMGSSHDDFRSMLLYSGATFADHLNFRGAANLWRLSYQLNFDKFVEAPDRLCDPYNQNTLKSVIFIVKLLFQWKKIRATNPPKQENGGEVEQVNNLNISEYNIRSVLRLLCLHSTTAMTWLHSQTAECRKRHRNSFNLLLRSIVCVIFVYVESFARSERNEEVWQYVKYAVSLNPRGERNETLLHMCLSLATLQHLDLLDTTDQGISWPSATVINIILILGANPQDCDSHGNTALHLAATLLQQGVLSDKAVTTIMQGLLFKGAHADQVNLNGQTTLDLFKSQGPSKCYDLLQKNVSLKCLAARVVTGCKINYAGEVPTSLYSFIELHRSIRR